MGNGLFLGLEVGGSGDSADTGMIEGWRGVRHREGDLLEREGGLWQLSVAEEVSLELMGHQDSPRRVTGKMQMALEPV